jgi:hypothetical protein
MNRKILASVVIAVAIGVTALGGTAMAQPVLNNGTTTTQPTGISKPPPGTAPPSPKRLNRTNASVLGNNTPTLPQIALHPTATIGSSIPIAGPGGTSSNPTGN